MASEGHYPRKRFGQHWLKDEAVLSKIIQSSEICSDDRILEIGPGKGALTNLLLKTDLNYLYSIEIDKTLINGLKNKFSFDQRFSLAQGDILSHSILPPDGNPLNKVVANIPYNITGPILEKLLGRLGHYPEFIFKRLVILMQKEVADRILASPGKSDFSALSVRIQLLSKCKEVCSVPASSFFPSPKVFSKVVIFEPIDNSDRLPLVLERSIDKLLQVAFSLRRKKLKNTLVKIFSLDQLHLLSNDIGFSLDNRPQDITVKQWVSLAKHYTPNK